MKVTIKKMGINGEGIGYIDKTPTFIPGALLHEDVDIRVIERQKRYALGEVTRVLKKDRARIQPKCRIQHICGGCPLMIAKYPAQLQYKQEILQQSLIKYAHVNPRLIEKVLPSEDIFGYRNQCKMPVAENDMGELTSGLFMPKSNIFIDVKACWIHEPQLEQARLDILQILRTHGAKHYDQHTKKGIRSLILRGFENKLQCTIVTGNDTLSQHAVDALMNVKGVYSLWQSIHTIKKTTDVFGQKMIFLSGERLLPFTFDGLQLKLSPRSFFQLNTKQAKILYHTVASMVQGHKDVIVEAYSGIGAISLFLKDKATQIIGIESNKDAVLNANMNATMNHAANVSFICDDAANKLTYISKQRDIDLLVVDPPRSGLDDAMLECILRSKIKEIVYISCNPATLGKNIAALRDRYQVKKVQPLDMFPHTQHVETVVRLSRIKLTVK